MSDCDHTGREIYARLVLPNKHQHFVVQCSKCLQVIKSAKHGQRLYIKISEIPADAVVVPLLKGGENE